MDLSDVPYEDLAAELARRNAARRTRRTGPPQKPTPCPKCRAMCPTARLARTHCRQPRP